jgi:hypothetical protein
MTQLSPEREEQLLRYLDGDLATDEKAELEKQLELSVEMKTRLKELQTVTHYLQRKGQLETPPRNFTQRVMESLDKLPVRAAHYRNGLLLLCGILIASGIALWLLSYGVFDGSVTTLEVDVKNKWIPNPTFSIPFNAKILVNGIIFLNLALALVLLDRTVLKPLFQKRTSYDY